MKTLSGFGFLPGRTCFPDNYFYGFWVVDSGLCLYLDIHCCNVSAWIGNRPASTMLELVLLV
jgi:hypothetical protein